LTSKNVERTQVSHLIVVSAGVAENTLEDNLNVNYWGPRRVCDALITKLQKGGRIVNVCSGAGPMYVAGDFTGGAKAELGTKLGQPWLLKGTEELDEIAKTYSKQSDVFWEYYGLSKALLNAYTYHTAKLNPHLVVNAVSPGLIKTDMTDQQPALNATKPPSEGAIPIVYLMLDEEVAKKPQGRYYGSDCKRSPLDVYRGAGDPEYDGPDGE